MQMRQAGIPILREILEAFPKVTVILDHLSRAPVGDGPPYGGADSLFALARYKQVFLKVTPINVSPKSWGKGTPETFFAKLIDAFGASRIAWGSNFPNSTGTLAEILAAARRAFSFASAADQDFIFGRTAQMLYPVLTHSQ
jgi:predicted TIM-barrel fold metal-dependent hydrolase